MTRKTNTRLPAIGCPNCGQKTIARSSESVTTTVRELRLVCSNDDCGGSYVAQIAFIRVIRASAIPNPSVRLPFGAWSPKPANDDHKTPANDHGLGTALASIMSG